MSLNIMAGQCVISVIQQNTECMTNVFSHISQLQQNGQTSCQTLTSSCMLLRKSISSVRLWQRFSKSIRRSISSARCFLAWARPVSSWQHKNTALNRWKTEADHIHKQNLDFNKASLISLHHSTDMWSLITFMLQQRCTSCSCSCRSASVASRPLFSDRAVASMASLEFSWASRSFSLAWAPAASESFLL